MNPYEDTTDDLVKTYGRVHANGEQTHVALLSCGEGAYVAVAYDVYPGEYEPVAAECIAYDPTLEGAHQRAQRWMESNPKGVAGGGEGNGGGDGGSRSLAFMKKAAARLNEYGNEQMKDMQQQNQERPNQ